MVLLLETDMPCYSGTSILTKLINSLLQIKSIKMEVPSLKSITLKHIIHHQFPKDYLSVLPSTLLKGILDLTENCQGVYHRKGGIAESRITKSGRPVRDGLKFSSTKTCVLLILVQL